ncbi:MAG: acyl-CoA dehydrogenase family protein [Dehalococcoidia bacterium]
MTTAIDQTAKSSEDLMAIVTELGPKFASKAAEHDAEGSFMAENYQAMRDRKLFSAAIPVEFGGGGASHAEICQVLRELAKYDGATALSFSMHSHVLATLNFRVRNDMTPSSEPALRRIAAEELVLVSTGGSDWLEGSGELTKVEDGYRMTGRKVFSSGSPAGDLLLTTGVYQDPENGPTVMHFAVNMHDPAVTILQDWDTMGMRATGSNSVQINDLFLPEQGISLSRPQGVWHPFFDVVMPFALSMVMSVYLGIAESARDIAVEQAQKKREDTMVQDQVGAMDNELLIAQTSIAEMVRIADEYNPPSVEQSNIIARHKSIATNAVIGTVEKALAVSGGQGYFRGLGLERRFRDIQAARFHPIQEPRQHRFSGRIALGMDPVE